MTNLDKYLANNNIDTSSTDAINAILLYNTAAVIRREVLTRGRFSGKEHKNESVMFLVCASIEKYDVLKNNYKLNEVAFDFRFVNEDLATMLAEDSISNPHPFDTMNWG